MTKKAHYWARHLATIATEGITTKAYAEREGLSVASLYCWRSRLKADAAGKAAIAGSAKRTLVPVQIVPSSAPSVTCTLTLGPDVHLELPQLPDPHWLAALVSATAGRGH